MGARPPLAAGSGPCAVDKRVALVTLERMTTTAPGIDWAQYNLAAAGRPARRMVSQAIAAAGGDSSGRVALDLGAGGGADTLEFARQGWTVHAYDSDDTLTARLVDEQRLDGTVHFHLGDMARVDPFPVADVIYSAYALPMLGKKLPAVWRRLRAALRPGGVMAVDLFGDRDTWADRDDIATLSESKLDAMFDGLTVHDRSVRDEPGRAFASDGRKHWHVISTLAAAPRR